MKFSLALLLALCVIAVSANHHVEIEPRSETFDKVVSFLKGLVQKAVDGVKNLVSKFEDTFTNVKEKLTNGLEHAQDKIGQIVTEVMGKVNDLAAKGGAYKKCAEQLRPQFQPILDNAKEEIKKCGERALADVLKIHNDVQQHKEAIEAQVGKLEQIVEECRKDGILKGLECLKEKAEEIKTDVATLFSEAKAAISTAHKDVEEVSANARKCYDDVIGKTHEATSKLYDAIGQCANPK